MDNTCQRERWGVGLGDLKRKLEQSEHLWILCNDALLFFFFKWYLTPRFLPKNGWPFALFSCSPLLFSLHPPPCPAPLAARSRQQSIEEERRKRERERKRKKAGRVITTSSSSFSLYIYLTTWREIEIKEKKRKNKIKISDELIFLLRDLV